jgi:hypothetical protein
MPPASWRAPGLVFTCDAGRARLNVTRAICATMANLARASALAGS